MDARPKTVRDILHTGDQYLIPLFQRYYSWSKVHWERLRRDIWALMDDDEKSVHFLGPLVCTPTSHYPGSVPAYQLIDGQQRLTTLTVLLAALRDVALSRNMKDLSEEVAEDYLLHKRKQGTERYKVLLRFGDRQALTAIVEGQQDVSPYADRQVVQAWGYFRRHVQHWARKDTEQRLRKLLDTVTRRLSLVVVTIEGENPYEIFESLNSTGLPLEEADLIRNFVFMQLPLPAQQEFFDQHWDKLEAMFAPTAEEPAAPMTPFYRDYLMRTGRYSKENATFIDFKLHQHDAALSPEKQVQELKHFAALDLMLRRPHSAKNESLRRALQQIDGMEITTAYPLLLNLLDRNDHGQLSDEDLCGCLQDLVSFVLRRSICGESSRTYGRWFVEAIASLRENPRKELQEYWLAHRWPDDSALRERIMEFAIYRRESRKARVILEAIEQSFGHKEKVDLSSLSIEHVMPQTITNNAAGKSWKAMLGDAWVETHEKLLHTLGNLTLTGYNPDLSNSSFETKKELLAQSHLDLNLHFTEKAAWHAETIRTRTAALAKEIIRLWPRPETGVGYSASTEALPQPDGLSAVEKNRLEYWRQMDGRLEERGVPADLIIPGSGTAINITVGKTGFVGMELGMNQQRNRIFLSLDFKGDLCTDVAKRLADEKATIEQELAYKPQWKVEGRSTSIFVCDDGVPLWDRDDWPVQHDWFGDRLEDFQRVLVPRVIKYEQEALLNPTLRQTVEKHRQRVEYWCACAAALRGGKVAYREKEPAAGRDYCRFEQIDTGILFGTESYPKEPCISVYLSVSSSAGKKQRSLSKDLQENHFAELEAEIGEKLEWSEPYYMASTVANVRDKADWPRQHKWIRETAEKFLAVFKSRLELA